MGLVVNLTGYFCNNVGSYYASYFENNWNLLVSHKKMLKKNHDMKEMLPEHHRHKEK